MIRDDGEQSDFFWASSDLLQHKAEPQRMRNPYAKPSMKRPRPEQQPNPLDQSFDCGLDWNEAVKVLDQASQSYQNKCSAGGNESTAEKNLTGPQHVGQDPKRKIDEPVHPIVSRIEAKQTGNRAGGLQVVDSGNPTHCTGGNIAYEVDNLNEAPQYVPQPAERSVGSIAQRSGNSVLNPYRNPSASSAVEKRDLSQSNADSNVDVTDGELRACVLPRTLPAEHDATKPTSTDLSSDSKLPPSRSATWAAPRPTSWGSSLLSGSTGRPSSSSGPMAAASNPNRSVVPRPPTWAPISAASPGHSVAFRPWSSPGQFSHCLNPACEGLPRALQYGPERAEAANDEYRPLLVKNANLSVPMLNGWTLFSHQKKAILQALLMRHFILALDMGLGKTLIGCVWAKAFQQTYLGLKIFVVCPVSLKKEWKRTAEEATGLQVDDNGCVEICSWAKVPSEVSSDIVNFVVVLDEAHSMQSMQATRTKEALKLVESQRCVGALLLTGTPMKNGKPLNLFPLLKAVRHPFGDNQIDYETHFCAGQQKSFGQGRRPVWDANGATNLTQLRQHVASHLLYMTKEEVLAELPPKTRVFRQVPVSSRHQLQHNAALNDLAKAYTTSGSFENSGDLILTSVQKVRQIGSFAKIDATVSLAKEVLEEEPAVVIFTFFATVAKAVHKQLSESGWEGELLTGETATNKRQKLVDNFQAGLSPVFVSTYGAGGVGLTLTAAHTIILLDRPWTPGEAQQAEDRVRRIGQTKPVRSIWMVAFDLDKQIDTLLEQKNNASSAVLKNGQADLTTSSAPKISIFALLKSVLGNKKQAPVTAAPAQLNEATS